MTMRQLHQAISRATGEDVELIAHRGFSLVNDDPGLVDDDWETLALDWDDLETQRSAGSRRVA